MYGEYLCLRRKPEEGFPLPNRPTLSSNKSLIDRQISIHDMLERWALRKELFGTMREVVNCWILISIFYHTSCVLKFGCCHSVPNSQLISSIVVDVDKTKHIIISSPNYHTAQYKNLLIPTRMWTLTKTTTTKEFAIFDDFDLQQGPCKFC